MSLFVPLEMVIGRREVATGLEDSLERIRDHLRTSVSDDSDQLLVDLELIARRIHPALRDRFASLAAEWALPGWQGDVEAFHRFAQNRNDLVHRGNESVSLEIRLEDGTDRNLEDIVERYVCRFVFPFLESIPANATPTMK